MTSFLFTHFIHTSVKLVLDTMAYICTDKFTFLVVEFDLLTFVSYFTGDCLMPLGGLVPPSALLVLVMLVNT